MGVNWFVTGGAGFIGCNLIHTLIEETSDRVFVYDDLSVGSRQDLSRVADFVTIDAGFSEEQLNDNCRVALIEGDILDYEHLQAAVKASHASVMVHLAANTGVAPSVENPRRDMEINVAGTFNCLEAARSAGIERFVFASSGAPAGEVVPPIHEEIAPHPVSPYGASKLAGEGYCSAYARTFGLTTVGLRFGNVYGPRSSHKSSVVAKFIGQALRGETLTIYGSGEQTRDFIYIADLVAAIRRSAEVPEIGGELFQIATSRETTVREMLDQLIACMEEAGLPAPEVTYSDPRTGDVMRNFSDTSKALRLLGWKSEFAIEDGLRETLKWYLAQRS